MMAHPNVCQRNIDTLLENYDIIEVGKFLSDETILTEKEFKRYKTLLQKKKIAHFLTELLNKDLARFEPFRKAMIKFAMDTMYQTISQLSHWNSSSSCLPSTLKCMDTSVCTHSDGRALFSDFDDPTLTHKPTTTDQYSQAINCTTSQETGYDTEHPPLSQCGDTPRLKHTDTQPNYEENGATRQPSLESHSIGPGKEDSKSGEGMVKITNSCIHFLPSGLSTASEVKRPTKALCLSFQPTPRKRVSYHPVPSADHKVQESVSMDRKRFRDLIQECSYELLNSLNVDSLLPHLQKERLLTHEEFEALIHPLKTSHEKKNILLSILPTKGENAYERFLTCLTNSDDHSGHSYLVKLLTSILPSKSVSYV